MAADGGWGWVVVVGCCICHFFLLGFNRSIGIVFVLLQERFEASATDAALVAAMFASIRAFGGLFSLQFFPFHLLSSTRYTVTTSFCKTARTKFKFYTKFPEKYIRPRTVRTLGLLPQTPDSGEGTAEVGSLEKS